MKAVAQVDRNTAWLPAKPKGYFVVRCSTLLETDGGSDAIGMSHEALDVVAQMMLRIGIRDNACVMHYIRHSFGCNENKGNRKRSLEDSDGFVGWNVEDLSSAKNGNGCIYRIQKRVK